MLLKERHNEEVCGSEREREGGRGRGREGERGRERATHHKREAAMARGPVELLVLSSSVASHVLPLQQSHEVLAGL